MSRDKEKLIAERINEGLENIERLAKAHYNKMDEAFRTQVSEAVFLAGIFEAVQKIKQDTARAVESVFDDGLQNLERDKSRKYFSNLSQELEEAIRNIQMYTKHDDFVQLVQAKKEHYNEKVAREIEQREDDAVGRSAPRAVLRFRPGSGSIAPAPTAVSSISSYVYPTATSYPSASPYGGASYGGASSSSSSSVSQSQDLNNGMSDDEALAAALAASSLTTSTTSTSSQGGFGTAPSAYTATSTSSSADAWSRGASTTTSSWSSQVSPSRPSAFVQRVSPREAVYTFDELMNAFSDARIVKPQMQEALKTALTDKMETYQNSNDDFPISHIPALFEAMGCDREFSKFLQDQLKILHPEKYPSPSHQPSFF